jgi:tetratricopeptide (TPR) repeat protein
VRGDTRVLLLQGRTGCGKSSFLRAGLIPYLESRVPVFKFMPEFDINKTGALFVRCTGEPLKRLAERLHDWGEKPLDIGEGETIDLREIRGDAKDWSSFIRENGTSVDKLMETLGRIHDRFPSWLILVIDQAEEILTQTRGQPGLRDLFFEFITTFNESSLNLKLIVAFRSEFYADFVDHLERFYAETAHRRTEENRKPLARFFLDELSTTELIEAVKVPVSRSIQEPYLQRRRQPADWYKFQFEDRLPERIVQDVQAIKKDGSILPILQIACNRLYKIAKTRSGPGKGYFEIKGDPDYKKLGDMKQQVDLSLDETLLKEIKRQLPTLDPADATEELALWRDLLCYLLMEGDAAPLTDAFPEHHLKQLAQELGCKTEFDKMAAYLADEDQRILRDDPRSLVDRDGGESTVRHYSLGHEVLGPALREWQAKRNVVLERRSFVSNLLQKATPFIVWTFFGVAAAIALIGFAANGEVGLWGVVTIGLLLALAAGLFVGGRGVSAFLARNLIDSSMFKDLFVHNDDTQNVIRRMRESLGAGQSPSPSTNDRQLLRGADEALQAKPEKAYTVDDWVGRAIAAYAEQKLELSAEYFNRAARAPGAALAQQAELTFYRGAIFGELRRHDMALALYDELIARHLNAADLAVRLPAIKALVNKGAIFSEWKRGAEAVACCDDVVGRFGEAGEPALREQVARALVNKGIFLREMSRQNDAIAAFDTMISRFRSASEPVLRQLVAAALVNKGVALSRSERNEEAIVTYDQLVSGFGDAAEPSIRRLVAGALRNKGFRLGEMQRGEEALAVADEVIARFGGDPESGIRATVAGAFVDKGFRLSALQRPDEALAVYDELIALFNDASEPAVLEQVARGLLNKGVVLRELQRNEEAIAVSDQLLGRFNNPSEARLRELVAKALLNKGLALGELKRSEAEIAVYDEMFARFKDAIEPGVREQVARALVSKGVELSNLKRGPEEIATYDEVIARFADDTELAIQEQVATSLLYKSMTLGQLGRREDAVAVCDDLLARYRDRIEPAVRELADRAARLRETAMNAAT